MKLSIFDPKVVALWKKKNAEGVFSVATDQTGNSHICGRVKTGLNYITDPNGRRIIGANGKPEAKVAEAVCGTAMIWRYDKSGNKEKLICSSCENAGPTPGGSSGRLTNTLVDPENPDAPIVEAKPKRGRKAKEVDNNIITEEKPKVKRGAVSINLSLEELQEPNLQEVIAEKIIEALDSLPATTIKEMKAVVAIQEQVKKVFFHREEIN